MMVGLARRGRAGVLLAAACIALFTLVSPAAARSTQPGLIATGALQDVRAVDMSEGAQPVIYVATPTGLFRSDTPPYALWSRQNTLSDITALSVNPANPQDILYSRLLGAGDEIGTYRSTDGGLTDQRISRCAYQSFARTANDPNIVYAGSGFVDPFCDSGTNTALTSYFVSQLARSDDDGLSWSVTYTETNGSNALGGFSSLAVDPANAARVYVSDANVYLDYFLRSADRGQTWIHQSLPDLNPTAPYYGTFIPSSITVDSHSHIWVSWSGDISTPLYLSIDNGQSWTLIDRIVATGVDALQTDPLTDRLYIGVVSNERSTPQSVRLQAIINSRDNAGHEDRFGASTDDLGANIRITRNGYVISWSDASSIIVRPSPYDIHFDIHILPIIGAGNWNTSAIFSGAARALLRPLGDPISPTATCDGRACQYFVKGAAEALGHGRYAAVPLAPRLLTAQAPLSVGGANSTITYRSLAKLQSQRVAPPRGLHHGTMPVSGGTFVPSSPSLRPSAGYVVPSYFWRYMNDPRTAPGGWLSSIGLPLTPAVRATVTKSEIGTRTITIQAFQNAVLTYDVKNAAPFRVERANIGLDYAKAFPQAVR